MGVKYIAAGSDTIEIWGADCLIGVKCAQSVDSENHNALIIFAECVRIGFRSKRVKTALEGLSGGNNLFLGSGFKVDILYLLICCGKFIVRTLGICGVARVVNAESLVKKRLCGGDQRIYRNDFRSGSFGKTNIIDVVDVFALTLIIPQSEYTDLGDLGWVESRSGSREIKGYVDRVPAFVELNALKRNLKGLFGPLGRIGFIISAESSA